METFFFTTTAFVPATQKGQLDGFETRCSCGLTIKSSLRTLAQSETQAHRAWHESRGESLRTRGR